MTSSLIQSLEELIIGASELKNLADLGELFFRISEYELRTYR